MKQSFGAFISVGVVSLITLALALPAIAYIVYGLFLLTPQGIFNPEVSAGAAIEQYVSFDAWLNGVGENAGILDGNFGTSMRTRQPVLEMLNERLPASLELLQLGVFFSLLVALPLGVVLAFLRRAFTDNIFSIGLSLVSSAPIFWVALLLIYEYAVQRQVLPVGGRCALGADCGSLTERVEYWILPVASLVLFFGTTLALLLRDTILHLATQEATSGLKGRHIIGGIVMFVPRILPMTLVSMFSSLVVVEAVFAYPGVGRLVFEAGSTQDFALLLAVILLSSVTFAIVLTIGTIASALLIWLYSAFIFSPTAETEELPEQTTTPMQNMAGQIATLFTVLALLVLLAIAAISFIAPGDAMKQDIANRLMPPGTAGYMLGTDEIGRDMQARVLRGGQPMFIVASAVALLTLVAAVILGAMAGILPGLIGLIPTFFVYVYGLVWGSIAPLPILIAVAAAVSPDVRQPVLITYMTLLILPLVIPIVRQKFIAMRLGYSRALLPVAGYIVFGAMTKAMLLLAALDALGMATQPPTPSWGNIIAGAQRYMPQAPHVMIFPGIILTLTVFCLVALSTRLFETFDFMSPLPLAKRKRGDSNALFAEVGSPQKRGNIFNDVKD